MKDGCEVDRIMKFEEDAQLDSGAQLLASDTVFVMGLNSVKNRAWLVHLTTVTIPINTLAHHHPPSTNFTAEANSLGVQRTLQLLLCSS